jgi:hypothetical protein
MKIALVRRSAALWFATLFASFFAGLAADRLGGRDAHAQPAAAATIYVPPGGVVFRATDGKPIARISRDARGGALELYDDDQRVTFRAPAAAATRSIAGLKAWDSSPNPYVLDDGDPWTAEAPPSARPGPGF